MSLAVELLIEVCREQELPYTVVGDNKALLKIHFPGHDHIVLNAALGLNTDADLKLTKDKFYSYQLLSPVVAMPKCKAYIDPDTFDPYRAYITYTSTADILADIKDNFTCPLIIKRNSGTEGKNVFLCRSEEEINTAIQAVYSKQQIEYDHVLLAQEYVKPVHEYRVIILMGKVELVYLKDISRATYIGNLSPLHWQGAKSLVNDDQQVLDQIQTMVNNLYQTFPIRYAGLDIIEDETGKLWLIEINSTPQFGEFVKSNDPVYFKRIFEKALRLLADGKR